ncbi:MAG: class I SAM-dependent methyltransferase [Anaerolineaceae bacterium]
MKEQSNQQKTPQIILLKSPGWHDYSLLDSGNGRKLERFGECTVIRPEVQAMWQPSAPQSEWQRADAEFKPGPGENGGNWVARKELPERWQMSYNNLRFWAMLSGSRHLGVFPEQATHWDWISERIQQASRPLKVLNLFGYTALASLIAARAGAQVTHVDASKKVITWGRENQTLSGLEERPIRWLVDDAFKFVAREGRRASQYDGLILDPPKFGRGPKGEIWEFFKLMPDLLSACRNLLSPKPVFVVLTAYAVATSSLTLYYSLKDLLTGMKGKFEVGELITEERSAGHCISNALFVRWSI